MSKPDTITDHPITTEDAPVASFKRRGGKANLRKRAPPPPPTATKDSDEDSDYSSTDETGAKLPSKRRKTVHVVSSSSAALKPAGAVIQSDSNAFSNTITKSDDATKRSNWHNENEEEYLLRKRNGPITAPVVDTSTAADSDGVYRGGSQYKSFIRKNPETVTSKTGKMGPVKAPTNVRQVVTVDYAPDVCKDYKQTGFCGFGDTCKFLHAREDYKQGWQLDRDWEIKSSGKSIPNLPGKKMGQANKDGLTEEEIEDAELEKIPFRCVICKEDYKNPIVTKCGHYFCEKCALGRFRKVPSCAICAAGTGGMFNGASLLKRKLEKKKRRMEEKGVDEEGKAIEQDEEKA